MASTNKTTHYELSQYIGTDKPTYLTDYNQDMSRIDAGIYGAKSLADVNESAIGTLANLSTTAKTDLVSAINEVDGDVATNTANISTNTSNISTNSTNIGNLNNLTTASKSNLVSAINEVDANNDSNTNKIGEMSNLETVEKSNLVGAINEVTDDIKKFNLVNFKTYTFVNGAGTDITNDNTNIPFEGTLTVATNSDGSIFKIYGVLSYSTTSTQTANVTLNNTGINPDKTFDVSCAGIKDVFTGGSYPTNFTVNANGTISFRESMASQSRKMYFYPCLYFAKDFGETPTP
jgi:hypothetical protein